MATSTKRVTLEDIARTAGVGVATVDRVLNRRAPVTPKTAERVLAAAESLNYHAQGLMRRRLDELAPARRLGFILQKEQKWFYRALASAIEESANELTSIRASVDISFVGSLSPDGLATELDEMAQSAHAIGIVAVDHPKITEAVERAEKHARIFAMLSPLTLANTSGFVGIDGRKAGRTAGWAMSHLVPASGEVGLLVGSHRYAGHEALETGFRGYMRENAAAVSLRDAVVYLDDRAVAYEAASELLETVRDLNGIYHIGGGVSGVVRALEESGRGRNVAYICHESSPIAVRALMDGTANLIVETPVAEIARQVTLAMAESLSSKPKLILPDPVTFRLITPENI